MGKLFAVVIFFGVVVRAASEALWTTTCSDKSATQRWTDAGSGYPKQLDFGLYWLGLGEDREKAKPGGEPTRLYNPEAPTLIYIHGWTGGAGGAVRHCDRVDKYCLYCKNCKDEHWMTDKWLADGWNVGWLTWDQISDEQCERDVEDKIWFLQDRFGMRWRSHDPETGVTSYHPFPSELAPRGEFSLGDLCASEIDTAMQGYSGPSVRLVGHSLGTQLALKCSHALYGLNSVAAPQRIALLDPFFASKIWKAAFFAKCTGRSDHARTHHNDTQLETIKVTKMLWDDYKVPVELVQTSAFSESSGMRSLFLSHVPTQLEQHAAVARYLVDWCGMLPVFGKATTALANDNLDLNVDHDSCKHHAANMVYMLSYGERAPPITFGARYGSDITTPNCSVPTAACSDAEIRHIVAKQRLSGELKWVQARGFGTPEVIDNAFRIEPHKWIRKVSPFEETPPALGRRGWSADVVELLAILVMSAGTAFGLGICLTFHFLRRIRERQDGQAAVQRVPSL